MATINHPGAPRAKAVKLGNKREVTIDVTRCQIPLTHEDDMTFQNAQGKTVRGPEKEPKGFVIDLHRNPGMHDGEYFQHVHMILGRAQKLEWQLIRDFPTNADGEPDWSVFENGPPDYMCEVFEILEQRAKSTWPRMLQAQRELGMPKWEDIRPCLPDPNDLERYLYNAREWGFQCRPASTTRATVVNSQQLGVDAAAGPTEPSPFMRACGHLGEAPASAEGMHSIIRNGKRRR